MENYLKLFNRYVEHTNRINISFKQKKSNYKAVNSKRKDLYLIEIDEGILKDRSKLKKCDNGIYISKAKVVYLIELKGCDIERGFEQIIETYKYFYKDFNKEKYNLKVRIIISHMSKHINLDYNRNKLIKICKWNLEKNDIVVKEKYCDKL